jgi:hypothetical protein
MGRPVGLTLRNMLAIIAIVAVFCSALARPSMGWVVPLQTITVFVLVYAAQRAYCSIEYRMFWISYLVGVVMAVASMLVTRDIYESVEVVVIDHVWTELGHEERYENGGYEFPAFMIALMLEYALAVPAVAAYSLQFVSHKRDQP